MRSTTVFLAMIMCVSACQAQQSFPFDLKDNLVNVEAHINGKRVGAVLDSGTGTIIVSKRLASELKLPHTRSSLQAAGGGSGNQSLFPSKLQSVRLGPIIAANVPAYVLDIHDLSKSAGFRIDALLGYPIFLNHVVRVDYLKRNISIFKKNEAPACEHSIPIQILHGTAVVIAKVKLPHTHEAETVHLIVDLGTRHYAATFGGRFLETKIGEELLSHGQRQQIGTGTGGKIQGVTTNLPELDIGHQNFHNLSIALTSHIKALQNKAFDGTLGVPLWMDGSITFDYPNKHLCIETAQK